MDKQTILKQLADCQNRGPLDPRNLQAIIKALHFLVEKCPD